MLLEHELIPYQTSSLPPGPWLVFAPHPDDEVFGMGGAIALASNQGVQVEVVVVTGGGCAGEPQIRRKESENAGSILGVKRYHFWSIPDRSVQSAVISRAIIDPILNKLNPATIFLPGIQELHPDHRATTTTILPILKSLNYGGHIWLYEITRQGEINRLLDITRVEQEKKDAIHCFQSQLSLTDYFTVINALDAARSYTLGKEVKLAEGFWECNGCELGNLKSRIASYFDSFDATINRIG